MIRDARKFVVCFCFLSLLPLLSARVTHVDIATRTDVLNGQSFGDAGPYERITGKVYFSVPVSNVRNQRIVDLSNAVNLQNGEVEFSADFIAVRPKDPAKSNGTLFLENPNRGRPRILSLVDGGDEDLSNSAGDAWFLSNGYTVVSLGWQWDAAGPNALRLYAPIAKDHGKTITGLLRGDIMLSAKADSIPLGHVILGSIGGSEYPPSDPNDPRNTLTVRDSREAKRTLIPRTEWRFLKMSEGKSTSPSDVIVLNGGFQPGRIYEYIYAVSDPAIAGLGFAAVRDFASYAKHDPNTLTPATRVIAEGISQNGRFLCDFLYQGFNADEDGRIALDGILAHVAGAGRGNFNYALPNPPATRNPPPPSSIPPISSPSPTNPKPTPSPKKSPAYSIAQQRTTSSRKSSSPTHPTNTGDAPPPSLTPPPTRNTTPRSPPNVRIYHFTGLQHFSGPFPPARGEGSLLGQQLQSPLSIRYFWRAMINNMDVWLRSNTEPPPSQHPTIAAHTLVTLRKYSFPKIPNVNLPIDANTAYHLDYGPNWRDGILTIQPPKVSEAFTVLVPQVDVDGNELGGIHLPEITVPLATYTGWNLRDPSVGAPTQRLAFEGSFIPFPKDAAARKISADPRKSIAERYPDRVTYLTQFEHAVDDLVKQRWILPEDRPALLKRGAEEWDSLAP